MEKTKLLLRNYYDKFVSIAKRGNEAKVELMKSNKIIDALSDKIESLSKLMNNLSSRNKTLLDYEKYISKVKFAEKELDKYTSITEKDFKNTLLKFIIIPRRNTMG